MKAVKQRNNSSALILHKHCLIPVVFYGREERRELERNFGLDRENNMLLI